MRKAEQWPYSPTCLSDIIPEGDLRVLQSGCCDRLGRPLTVLDRDPQNGECARRINPLDEVDHYEPFCRLFRDLNRVPGGDQACVDCDQNEARASLTRFFEEGQCFRTFKCHMGLQDMTHVICIEDMPVAIVFSGQYRPSEGLDEIIQCVRLLGAGERAHIRPDDVTRQELLECAQRLPSMPDDAPDRLASEARYIQDFATARFRQDKRHCEEAFLDTLRRAAASSTGFLDRNALADRLAPSLRRICDFCRCEWAVCFGSLQEGDTLLAPLGSGGVPAEIAANLPHFNWKKAGLPSDPSALHEFDFTKWTCETGIKGIRGDNSSYFTRNGCLFVPVVQDVRYLSVLALGPFTEHIDLAHERRFLADIAEIVCTSAVAVLEVSYLQRERERWRTAAELLTHQLRTALTPINTRIGSAKALLRYNMSSADVDEARRLLSLAETMNVGLAKSSRETLQGHITLIEPSDLQFEYYPLSILVANIASGYTAKAQEKNCTIQLDSSVELLPQARVDVGRLSIAIGNLLENAVKYCSPDSAISVRARLDITDVQAQSTLMTVKIQVQDVGYPVLETDHQWIFEQGARGRWFATGRIPGAGLGLWEARLVARAHDGDVVLSSCEPVAGRRGREQAYRVVFEIRLPWKKEVK